MKIELAGENSLIIYFGDSASPEVSAQVQQASMLLQDALADVLIDVVPSYASLLVIYDAFLTDNFHVQATIKRTLSNNSTADVTTGKVVTLPVYYSSESGADLERLAELANLSVDEVIEIHQKTEYRVYAIGFAPGFAYLGEVDARIAAPRLTTPRLKVPRGAVAIADKQTAVYPAESPGGWNIIGSCPVRMFDLMATPTMPVVVGDTVKFKAITRDEFIALGGKL
ncbi:5-oxoprolinase subunit PxpB [Thalassotalea psychrophila]|uniref:5-oxoprolinase subunit PxpB n=1 Tax=Thalassotalea psychrophila TaxID=3065647 RepID=A0ABY9TQ39_9GAMM|nr:5-oxoprolinase subunit PxpB [Colwelliaceae bacterium SQ149]